MRTPLPLLLLLITTTTGCEGPVGLGRNFIGPTLIWVVPTDGEVIQLEQDPDFVGVSLQARVSDDRDAPEDLQLEMVLPDVTINSIQAEPNGDLFIFGDAAFFTPGPQTLGLSALDSDGVRESVEVEWTLWSAPPRSSVLSPAQGGRFLEGEEIELVGQADDDLTAAEDLVFGWVSDLEGNLAGALDEPGRSTLRIDSLQPGTHTIVFEAYDEEGNRGTDSVELTVIGGAQGG